MARHSVFRLKKERVGERLRWQGQGVGGGWWQRYWWEQLSVCLPLESYCSNIAVILVSSFNNLPETPFASLMTDPSNVGAHQVHVFVFVFYFLVWFCCLCHYLLTLAAKFWEPNRKKAGVLEVSCVPTFTHCFYLLYLYPHLCLTSPSAKNLFPSLPYPSPLPSLPFLLLWK